MLNNLTKYGKQTNTLTFFAIIFAFCVITLGAYTRLTDAGLGCPDWPGCYGQLLAPTDLTSIAAAKELYPDASIEPQKAKTEMLHRYFAGTLGLIILVIFLLNTKALFSINSIKSINHITTNKNNKKEQISKEQISLVTDPSVKRKTISFTLASLILAITILQALLGMWTVTLKLLPIVVMGHLLGGMTILALLTWLYLNNKQLYAAKPYNERLSLHKYTPKLKLWSKLSLIFIAVQIILGGWVSANYAALACSDSTFPFCQNVLFPNMDFKQVFDIFGGFNLERPHLFMSHSARVTTHMLHRFGAILVMLSVSMLAYYFFKLKPTSSKKLKIILYKLLLVLFVQLCLGIINVTSFLPLSIAVAHNGVAAILLITIISFNFYLATETNTKYAQ